MSWRFWVAWFLSSDERSVWNSNNHIPSPPSALGWQAKSQKGQRPAMGRQESQPQDLESMPYLMTHLSSAALPPWLKPPDPSSFPRSGFLMSLIQPKCGRMGSWEVTEWRLMCRKFIRDTVRLNAKRRKGEKTGLGPGRWWGTIQSQQTIWSTPQNTLKLGWPL